MNRLIVVVCLVVVVSTGLASTSRCLCAEESDPQGQDKVLKALAQKVDFKQGEITLEGLADRIAKKYGINVVLDEQAFEDVGIGSDTPVEAHMSGISLQAYLSYVLQRIEPTLTMSVHSDHIAITTREVAEENLITRVYDVRDLAAVQGEYFKKKQDDIRNVFAGQNELGDAPETYDTEAVAEMVASIVEPDSWAEVGGPSSIRHVGGLLVVSQTWVIHQKIDALLNTLRQVRERQKKTPGGLDERVAITSGEKKADQAIHAALKQRISLDFDNEHLGSAVSTLEKAFDVPVRLDYHVLEDVGVEIDSPVSIRLKNVSAKTGLLLMLRSIGIGLSYSIRDEMLLITTKEGAEESLTYRVYPVADLITPQQAEGSDPLAIDYSTLIETIAGAIEPDSWDEIGGAGTIIAYQPARSLIVRQTEETHAKLADLFVQFRAVRRKQLAAHPPAKPQPETDGYVTAIYHLAVWPKDASNKVTIEALPKLIQQFVEPESWRSDENRIFVLPSKLIVRQKKSVHRKVISLLRALHLLGYEFGRRPKAGHVIGGG